jgi:hypothetical protein
MLALLPLFGLALLIVWQALAVRPGNRTTGWEHPCLVAATIWGALAVVLVELLGAARALTPTTLALGWAGVTLLLTVLVIRRARAANGLARPFRPTRPTRSETAFGVLLIVYLAALLVVALVSPPNNIDSFQYHMPRVAHWIQNQTLAPYATQFEHQLYNPPGAEILILTLQALYGSDRLANLVQWLAFLGALIAVSGIGRQLGASKYARLGAIAFAAVAPMAVLQATSTQNDLVSAFWLIAFAYFAVLAQRRALSTGEWAAAGLALGMGILTKSTLYVYGLPFLILLAFGGWTMGWRRLVRHLAIVLGLAALLNLPIWWRNQTITGTPLGPVEIVTEHGAIGDGDGQALRAPLRGLRMLLINFTTPFPGVNDMLADGIRGLHARTGLEAEEPILVYGWNHEDLAGSPLHLAATALAAAVALARWRQNRLAGRYAVCVIAGYLLLPWVLANVARPVNIRYQLPFYLAGAPLVALLFDRWVPSRALGAISSLILLLGLPWLLFNNTRPLVGLRPDASGGLELPCIHANLLGYECTRIGSVLTMPEVDVLFANIRDSEDDALAMVAALEQTGCRQVGLRIDSHDPEYVYWHLLDAPRSVYRLETIYTVPRLEPLIDRSFSPCAIICTICGDRDRLHGLDLYHAAGEVKLFVGDGFTWNEDG